MFFEILDGQNILQDQGVNNPVTALIGIDISHYESKRSDAFDENILDIDSGDDVSFDDYYFQVEEFDSWSSQIDWARAANSTFVHPVFFSKCLTKAVDVEYTRIMDYPSNGVSVVGVLRPTFSDEEMYLRRLFRDRDFLSFSSGGVESCGGSIIYRMEITKIELFSVYGAQSMVSVQDFQYADPDVLVHLTASIIDRFVENGSRFNLALKALCKKKGLNVEGVNLIGVDSFGMDVRVSSGTEVQTHRFSFKVQAMSVGDALKQIQQLLFPRPRRKKWTVNKPKDIDFL